MITPWEELHAIQEFVISTEDSEMREFMRVQSDR